MPNIAESLKKAAAVLSSAEIADPRREASSLLCFALGKDRIVLGELRDDEAPDRRQVSRRRILVGVGQASGVDEVRAGEADLLPQLVHHISEGLLAAADPLG